MLEVVLAGAADDNGVAGDLLMLHRRAFYPLLALICGPALAAVALEVRVDAQPIPERAKDVSTAKPLEASSTLEKVRIEEKLLVVEAGWRRTVIDFAARKKYAIDLAARAYSEGSLFVDAGFKSMEILNREGLARALAAVQPDRAQNAVALAEHELSVVHPRQPGKIDAQGSSFRIGELVVFSFAREGAALSESDAAGLGRYLRYFKAGHPIALAALKERRIAPAHIGLVSPPFHAVQTTLRVRPIPLDEAPSASLQGLRKIAPSHARSMPQDLSLAAFQIGESTFAEISRAVEETGRRADALVAQGRPVQGFMAALEYILQGAPAQDLMRRHRDTFLASAELQAIMPVLDNAPDKAGAETAVAALSTARSRLGEDAAILGVFEANHHVALGRPQVAAELFMAALRSNRYIAGAWKDLGDLLFRQWEPAAAWVCWDTARRIAPRFGNLVTIDQFESRLLRDYPEYF